MMIFWIRVITCLAGLGVICLAFRAVRHRELSEMNAIPWLAGGGLMILLGLFPWILWYAAEVLDLGWPPASIFFAAILVIIFMLFGITKQLSKQQDKIAELSMQVTLLKDALAQARQEQENSPANVKTNA